MIDATLCKRKLNNYAKSYLEKGKIVFNGLNEDKWKRYVRIVVELNFTYDA